MLNEARLRQSARERADGDHLAERGRPGRPPDAAVARRDDAHHALVLAQEPEPRLERDQRQIMPGRRGDGQVEDVHAVAERVDQPRHEVRFQRAARDRESIRHDDVRLGRHAPRHPGDERAVPGVGRDRLRPLPGSCPGRSPTAPRPATGGRAPRPRAGRCRPCRSVRPAPPSSVAHRRVRLDPVVHLLRFGGRAGTRLAARDRQDVIRRRDALRRAARSISSSASGT